MKHIPNNEYFISINALKRALVHLIHYDIHIPNNIQEFINQLNPNHIQNQAHFKTLKRIIEQELIEHEDDGFPESLCFEFLLIAISVLDFYDENDLDILISIQDSAIELYTTQFANEYMINNGKPYYIFSDDENEMIENNPLAIQEKIAQEKDRAFIYQNIL